MALPKFFVYDPYIVNQLKQEYEATEQTGRIRFLRKFCRRARSLTDTNVVPPVEIASLAVKDPNPMVRQWAARSLTRLVYRHDGQPDTNLAAQIEKDADPLVRASLFENPRVLRWLSEQEHSLELFRQASHLERLALLRNPEVGLKLLIQLFDWQDDSLDIEPEERKELVVAYLTNSEHILMAILDPLSLGG